jgi:hypothetical protein
VIHDDEGVRPDPLLHIGYHKTGTTWLQHRVFNAGSFGMPVSPNRLFMDFVSMHSFAHPDPATTAALRSGCAAIAADGRQPVLSQERLSGSPHSGGHDSRLIADRLKTAFSAARVLIVIREQRQIIRSNFLQYVTVGGPLPFEKYTQPARRGWKRLPTFRFDFFEYHHLIAYYHQLFSPEAVLVLPYEQLRADPEGFVAAISRHVDAPPPMSVPMDPVNVSSPALAAGLKRWANRVLVRDALNPSALVDGNRVNGGLRRAVHRVALTAPAAVRDRAESRLTSKLDAAVGTRYRESNARTAELTGLDLAAWGYQLAE